LIKNIILISIKLLLFSFLAFVFWSINTPLIVIIISILYLIINISVFVLFFRTKKFTFIFKSILCIIDFLLLIYFICFTVYFIINIPGDGDERFATLFAIICGVNSIILIGFIIINLFIINKNRLIA